MDGQRTKFRRNIAENYYRLGRVHERYQPQTTDRQTDRRTDDSIIATFTFATRPNFTKFSVPVIRDRGSVRRPLATLRYDMYFRFCGWRHVYLLWALWRRIQWQQIAHRRR